MFVESNSFDISPNISFGIFWFISTDSFGLNIFFSVSENSKFVIGFGDTTLTGPLIEVFVIE